MSNYRNIVIHSQWVAGLCQQGEMEPDDIVLAFGKGTASALPESIVETMHDLFVQSLNRIQSGIKSGVSTGLSCIDNVMGGFRKGELIILGARPSVGKSALGLQYAYNVAKQRKGSVLFVSIEMSGDMITQRLIQMLCRIDGDSIANNYLNEEDKKKIVDVTADLKDLPLLVSTQSPLTLNSVRAKARDAARAGGIALIVVDYLQMIEVTNTQGRTRDVGVISRGLKALAREFDCPVVALSSLSRATESRTDKRPIMSDLRESGDIESDADVVQFLYRPDYYDNDKGAWDDELISETELITAKNRNGKIGMSALAFEKRYTTFKDNEYNGQL
jgi:replicative DNA helicase